MGISQTSETKQEKLYLLYKNQSRCHDIGTEGNNEVTFILCTADETGKSK